MTREFKLNTTAPTGVRESSPLLVVRGVSKAYGPNAALRPTDFDLAAGECVAIIGENGAGKSTFAKVLTGTETPDSGTIQLVGEHVSFGSPRNALQHGVALIPQELAYVPGLTVAENVMLNRLPGRFGLTTNRGTVRAASDLMERLGLWVEPLARMVDLGVSEQQIVELVKALGRQSRLLVLDEPTAALTEEEAEKLYSLLEEQRRHGIGVIVISHHLEQINRFASRIDVFRDGARVFSEAPSKAPTSFFIQEMLGTTNVPAASAKRERPSGDVLLHLQDWKVEGRPGLNGVSIKLRRGEVLGVYGIRGSGSELLAQGLGGRKPSIQGQIWIDGRDQAVFGSPRAAIKAGIAYVPPDRKHDGLVPGQPVRTAVCMLVLRRLARFGVLRAKSEVSVAATYATRFRLKAQSLAQPVGELSGGNQQKVLLASRLAASPSVLVVHEPTRGVDIGARHEIHETLRSLTVSGMSVLVVTSDVEEVVEISDRLLIIRSGTVAAELVGDDITQDKAVHMAAA